MSGPPFCWARPQPAPQAVRPERWWEWIMPSQGWRERLFSVPRAAGFQHSVDMKGILPAAFLCALALPGTALPATTFTVNNTSDSGAGSLRQAILDANATADADRIVFNIPGPNVHTISPLSSLPALTDDAGATIDGYSQPGSSPNTLAVGDNAVLKIELNGALAGSFSVGIRVQASSNSI